MNHDGCVKYIIALNEEGKSARSEARRRGGEAQATFIRFVVQSLVNRFPSETDGLRSFQLLLLTLAGLGRLRSLLS